MLLLPLLFVPLSFSLVSSSASSVRVLQSDLSHGDKGKAMSGAQLMDERSVELKDFALCIRFYVEYLQHQDRDNDPESATAPVLDISTQPEITWFQFNASYPRSHIFFGHPRVSGSFNAYVLRDSDTGSSELWDTYAWSHLCFSYEKSTSFVKVAKDGKMLNVNFRDDRVGKVTFPKNILQNVHIGRCSQNWLKDCSALGGKFSDFNLWDRPLTDDEMRNFTSCRDMSAKGNVVSWDLAQFNVDNMSEIFVARESICKSAPGDVLMLDTNPFSSHVTLCEKMRGEVSIVHSQEKQREMFNDVAERSSQQSGTCDGHIWTGYWDVFDEGIFRDVNTNNKSTELFSPWAPGEPNGFTEENCAAILETGMWLDYECSKLACGFCSLPAAPVLRIRGLCSESLFDHKYSWTGDTVNGKFTFFGMTTSQLQYNKEQNEWNLRLLSSEDNSTYAAVKGEAFPFGSKRWEVFGDVCHKDEDGNVIEKVAILLNLNNCKDNEFNCIDGSCVSMENRCDGTIQCKDRSDELECQTLLTDPTYLKFMPPAGESIDFLFPVQFSVEVLNVLAISEVDNFITLQLQVQMSWKDERLTMFNLKEDSDLNALTFDAIQKLWLPEVVFFNTDEKYESLNDEKASAVVDRNGSFTLSPTSTLHNAYTFQGSNNPIMISRVYDYKYLCDFDMSDYPFDSQTCSAVFVMRGNLGKFVRLIPNNLKYIGPIDLTQYFVQNSRIYEQDIFDGEKGIKVELVFARRLLSTFLTTYLPTLLICTVSFTTNFYKSFFFEAIVTVNLTSMLLLVTLFISVSESLPKTAYVKYIDIWLIFVLFVPFSEVAIHTLIDNLRTSKERVITQSGTSQSTSANHPSRGGPNQGLSGKTSDSLRELLTREQRRLDQLRMFLFISRFGLPAAFLAFGLGYFMYGIILYNNIGS